MRSNIEQAQMYNPRISGVRYNNVVMTLTGTLVIPNDGPTVWALNGGASDRTVRLPALQYEREVIIANLGTTNVLNVTDSVGAAIVSLPASSVGMYYASTQQWVFLVGPSTGFVVGTTVITVSGPVAATDIEVQVNGAGAVVLTLPNSVTWAASSGWRGLPLSITDISGNAATNNITINPSGGQTISNLASLTIDANYGSFSLRPKSGGGWLWR